MNWRALVVLGVLCGPTILRADEGYWLFSDPPTAAIADKYHFTLDEAWLNHLRGAAVRIGGASGSFVSEDGLVITNRHVGEGQLHTLSSSTHNYEENGFYAPTPRDELPCQGIELLVLQSTRDVTAQVEAALKPGATPDEAEAEHKAIEAAIEKESFDRTGLYSEVVTLFGGARYDLYQYKKYPDVRLVFAPDWQTASFGGDPDNFEFPRFDLDICLFRVYDHGRPLSTPDYLKWNSAGPAKDELVFVAGHPGSSQRLVTMDEIAYQRDVRVPVLIERTRSHGKGADPLQRDEPRACTGGGRSARLRGEFPQGVPRLSQGPARSRPVKKQGGGRKPFPRLARAAPGPAADPRRLCANQ